MGDGHRQKCLGGVRALGLYGVLHSNARKPTAHVSAGLGDSNNRCIAIDGYKYAKEVGIRVTWTVEIVIRKVGCFLSSLVNVLLT
jgi:hypothetical protein